MRFGIVGCGWIAERDHIPAMLHSSDVEIVATADTSLVRARLAGSLAGLDEHACYTDYRQLLDRRDVEVISVATPPSTRVQIVTDAAAAGKHIVCEKPFALTLDEADRMIAACERAGVTLAVYHNYLYYYEHRLASRLIAEGAIGDVVATEICGLGSEPWPGTDLFKPGWRLDPRVAGGGVVMDIGVHAYYLTELFHPLPAESVTANMRFAETGADDHAYCLISMGGGGTGIVNVAWGQGSARFEIDGMSGYISYVYDEGAGYFGAPVRAVRVVAAGRPTMVYLVPPGRTQFTPDLFDDLVASITGTGDAYRSFGPNGRRTLEIAHAAYQSAVYRQPVALPISPSEAIYREGTAPLLLGEAVNASAG
jgi:predicted dehydrogenase